MAKPKPRIHDYRRRYWGHDYTLTPDPDPVTARIAGWGHGLRVGDFLVIPRSSGGSTLYEIKQIRYCMDPSDMWFSHCRFVRGSSRKGKRVAAVMQRRPEFSSAFDSLASWWVLDA